MNNFERPIRSLVLRFIESLLKLYPPRFRHEFYSEIQAVILSRLRDAEQTGQWPCAVVHEITGLVSSIIQERWHDLRFRKEMMMIANKKPGWFFYCGWVALNASAVIMAWYITFAIMDRVTGEDDSLIFILLFPIIGLLTGILQYIVLRRYLPHLGWWISATFLGWLMPFVWLSIFSRLLIPGSSTVRIVLGMMVLGTTVALPQWWLLRKRVQHAWWWVLVFGLAWGMVGLFDLFTLSDLFPVVIGFAVVPAIATSIAWWLLLDRLPNHELRSAGIRVSFKLVYASSKGASPMIGLFDFPYAPNCEETVRWLEKSHK